MTTRHTPTEYAQILQSYIDKGKSVGEFCKYYHLRAQYVAALVMRFNINHKKATRSSVTMKHVERWILQYQSGRNISWIAKRSQRGKSTISAYLAAFDVYQYDQYEPDSRNMLERPNVLDWHAYKLASIEAADYWKDRCAKFHRYWIDEMESNVYSI
jgi:hypothetical protein